MILLFIAVLSSICVLITSTSLHTHLKISGDRLPDPSATSPTHHHNPAKSRNPIAHASDAIIINTPTTFNSCNRPPVKSRNQQDQAIIQTQRLDLQSTWLYYLLAYYVYSPCTPTTWVSGFVTNRSSTSIHPLFRPPPPIFLSIYQPRTLPGRASFSFPSHPFAHAHLLCCRARVMTSMCPPAPPSCFARHEIFCLFGPSQAYP
ncbi:hypothetical protein GALMADRAFT_849430 [Galerina marginata CBS 339.88]|uniref:Secreted protein n=1 Tax=Galerina marginata (strain CBS 339.88) TaxID=685588 RepID=A0A067THT1_GALM3|nr:hypothetical protein GALMADRAFT_849430 [Galerina marginata CBS 339.88]